jgi:hypothetical protein
MNDKKDTPQNNAQIGNERLCPDAQHVLPDRGELARLLVGTGKKFSPERDSVAELIAKRELEG